MPWRWPWYRRQHAEASSPRHPLREFVYLDEISVYSLLASRSGPVPTHFTDTESESLQDQLTGGVSIGVPGAKSEIQGASNAEKLNSSQIVRKASAQARFKQFLEAEEKDFVFRATADTQHTPDPAGVDRGDLFEMQVELNADETFQISTTITALVEILTENQAQLEAYVDHEQTQQVLAYNRILERLLVGLIPIKAKAVDYVVLNGEGTRTIARRSDLDDATLASDKCEPLYVVSSTQEHLWWKDIRTVLFGHQRYVLTGRLLAAAPTKTWSPVKLAEVLRSVLPSVADQLDEAGRGVGAAMRASAASPETSKPDRWHEALVDFATRITTAEITAEELREILDGWNPPAALDTGELEETRKAFASAVELIRTRTGDQAIDEAAIARNRSDVIVEHGLPPAPSKPEQHTAGRGKHRTKGWFLETEVIAVYW